MWKDVLRQVRGSLANFLSVFQQSECSFSFYSFSFLTFQLKRVNESDTSGNVTGESFEGLNQTVRRLASGGFYSERFVRLRVAHPWLRTGEGEQVHFAEVISRGQQGSAVGAARGVDVRAVGRFRPNSWEANGEQKKKELTLYGHKTKKVDSTSARFLHSCDSFEKIEANTSVFRFETQTQERFY